MSYRSETLLSVLFLCGTRAARTQATNSLYEDLLDLVTRTMWHALMTFVKCRVESMICHLPFLLMDLDTVPDESFTCTRS